jgi:hypothetical protein
VADTPYANNSRTAAKAASTVAGSAPGRASALIGIGVTSGRPSYGVSPSGAGPTAASRPPVLTPTPEGRVADAAGRPYLGVVPPDHRTHRRTGLGEGAPHARRPDLDRLPVAAWEAAGEIFAPALRLGGTLTGEHGVGVLKRQWVAEELGPAAHALQRRIKEVFDPRGILNPGKAL